MEIDRITEAAIENFDNMCKPADPVILPGLETNLVPFSPVAPTIPGEPPDPEPTG